MPLQQQIDQDLKSAMIERNEAKVSTLRFLKSALKYVIIEKKTDALADADIQQVIQKQIKQRRESIDQYQKGARAELAQKEMTELLILESYLPKQMSEADLEKAVTECLKREGATTKKDFGRMMKTLNDELKGAADSKRISEALGKHLK